MSQHDFIISDAVGLPIRLDLQGALQALVTNSSGATAPATTYANQLWLDTSVLPDGLLKQRNQANSAWIAIAGFPPKASSAEVIAGTDDIKFVTPLGVAARDAVAAKARRNRIVNGGMQVSQELGDSGSGTTGAYIADQWTYSFVGPTTVGAFRSSVTVPNGAAKSVKRINLNVVVNKAVLAAGDFMLFQQGVEGLRVADFAWGAAGARQAILRFIARVAVAGTYCVAVRNSANNRSWVGSYTIAAAGVDTEVIMVIPGDVTGTWLTDTGVGMYVAFVFAAGTTFLGVAGWQAGNFLGITGMSNGAATVNAGNHIAEVGLYLDVDATGIPPLWEMPDEATELLACQRYYVNHVFSNYNAFMNASQGAFSTMFSPVEMRTITPTMAGVSVINVGWTATATPATITGRQFRESRTMAAAVNASAHFMTEWSASARL